MSIQFVLLLSDHTLSIYHAAQRKISGIIQFSTDENGLQAFTQWLEQQRCPAVSLVVDSRYEEYLVDVVPHVSGQDQKNLFRHRLTRHYPKSPYRYACVQRHLPAPAGLKRSNDQALFSCINNDDILKPWIKALLLRHVPIRGIYSLPLLLQRLLPFLQAGHSSLLVTHSPYNASNGPQSMRQSYFLEGHLQVSRPLAVNVHSNAEYAGYLTQEILKTQHYLEMRNILPPQEAFEVILLAAAPWDSAAKHWEQQQPRQEQHIRYRCVELDDLAASLSLDAENLDLGILVAGVLSQRRMVANHYAQASQRRYFYYQHVRQALYASSAAVLLGGVAVAGNNAYQVLQLQQEQQDMQQKITTTIQRRNDLNEKQRQHSGVETDVVYIKNTVESVEFLQHHQLDIRQGLSLVSQYLNDYPLLRLNDLKWYGVVPEEPPSEEELRRQQQPQTQLNKMLATRGLNQKKHAKPELHIFLNGELWPFDGNYTKALDTVKQFQQALEKSPKIKTVKTIRMPLNAQPGSKITGSLSSSQTSTNSTAPFSLEVVISNAETKAN